MSVRVVNAISVDLEDWYQVANLERLIRYEDWERCEDRLTMSVGRTLDVLRSMDTYATFFVLGWNGERHPELIERVAEEGHELGTHGYSHKLVYRQQPEEFAKELRRSVDVIRRITGRPVLGHRAASFSITNESRWAFAALAECGIQYDSSVMPIRHHRYGIPEASPLPHVAAGQGTLVEFPVSTINVMGRNIPFAGGAYFRFLPYAFVKACVRFLNRRGIPVMFYVHPWEMDPGQRRMDLDWKRKMRCYYNIEKTEAKLRRLLADFPFGRAVDVLRDLGMDTLPRVEVIAQSCCHPELDSGSAICKGDAESSSA